MPLYARWMTPAEFGTLELLDRAGEVAAICLLVPGLSGALGMVIGADSEFVRMMVATMLTFPLGIVAFKVFFDMDFIDAIYCVIIISLVNDWAMTFLMGLIFSSGGGI